MADFQAKVSIYDNGKPDLTTDMVEMNKGKLLYQNVTATILIDGGRWGGYFNGGVHLGVGTFYVLESSEGIDGLIVGSEIRGSFVRFEGSDLPPFSG